MMLLIYGIRNKQKKTPSSQTQKTDWVLARVKEMVGGKNE